ncbi:MAG: glycoside hydrolase family 105 protein [Mangrovibacterium sp.]
MINLIEKTYLNILTTFVFCLLASGLQAQEPKATDVTIPLHLMNPDYPVPYRIPETEEVKAVLDRVYGYLKEVTPAGIVDRKTGEEISSLDLITPNAMLRQGDFRLTSYEWGVTYAGMLLAGEVTGDKRYTDYTGNRLNLLADLTAFYREHPELDVDRRSPVHSVLHPAALDDAGAICAAMIKSERREQDGRLRPMIDNFIGYIHTKEYRLADGTLARNRPHRNTLWLDDLFMSVPALAQMGKFTGEKKYYDDAVKQVLQFSRRMFVPEKGLYMHGWVEHMQMHPRFHWGRANGWAVMTLVELLEVLPRDHEGFLPVLEQLQAHVAGLAACQDGTGFWHQLLDRPDTYLETSATAIYTYALARAINRGYIDKYAYAPVVLLAWNAVSTRVNEKGQVEGTCVGTGMAFDPAFYCYRPVNPYAAHGYGPVLLAGAELISLLNNSHAKMNDSAVMFYPEEIKSEAPIFSVD